jgi:hypothetical protein
MSTTVGTLTIEMVANIARLQKGMDAAMNTVDTSMGKITKTVETAMRTMGTLFAGVSVGVLASKLVSVQREFDVLNSSLITVTGSSEAAEKAFAMLEDFASTTPFSLAEVTRAFTKLKALGLDPSAEALRSYGNTASAMGKSLNDMIEAVADAATGEFERLKEFGIKSKSEGDRVTFTFKGLSTTIGKNAAEIEAYLRRIGDVDFAGATELRAKTLDGALSNLGDTYDKLFRTIASGDVGGVIADGVRLAIGALEILIKIIQATSSSMSGAAKDSAAFGAIMNGIAVVFETVAVVGVNVKFVITQIINEVVGLSKQVAAIAQGNFAEVGRIGDQMKAEAEAARRQVDITTQTILSARNSQSMSFKETENDLLRLGNRWVATGSSAADAYAKELAAANATKPAVTKMTDEQTKAMEKQQSAYAKLINDIEGKTGAMLLEQQQTEKLSDSQKLALKIMQDIQTGTLKLNDAQKIKITQSLEELLTTERLNAEMKDLAKTQQAAIALSDKLNAEQYKTTESMRATVVSLIEQNDELRLGKDAVIAREVAVMRATAADLDFAATMVEGNEHLAEQARLLRQQADLTEDNAMLAAAKEANKELDKTTESVESIESNLTDALMRGFESGKGFGQNLADTLENMFKTLILKPIIEPIAKGASNVLLSMMGMALPGAASAGGGGGAAGMMQGLTLSMQAFGSTLGTGFMNTIFGTGGGASFTAAQSMFASGNTAAGLGMGAGTLAGYGAGAAAGVYGGRAISGGYAVSGSGNGMVNAGTALGMVLGGPIGAAIGGAIAGGVNRLFGRKQTDMGIEGTLTTAEGIEGQSYQFLKGGLFRSNKTITSALASEVEVLFDSSIELITKQTRGYAAALGLPAAAIDNFTQQIKLSFQGLSEEEINQKIADTLVEFQEGLASQYASALEPLKIAGETFSQTIQRLIEIQDVSIYLNEFGGAFSTFATASITARQGIIELAGGLDALVQKTQGFVANFYSKEEQAGITARGVVQALETAGFSASQIAALETRADFRTLLESIDVSTSIGQQQFVALLDMQASFAGLSTVMEEQQQSLLGLIEAAPQVEILQKMFESDAEYQKRVETANDMAWTQAYDLFLEVGKVDLSINNMTVILANRLDRLATDMATAQAEANAQAANAISIANASAAAAIAAANAAAAAAAEQPNYMFDGAAMGGYIDGPTLVGEHGPELFDPRQSQIYTAPATSNIFGGNEVAAEIRALRDEVSMMRYETRSTATNTAKIARLQDNWDVRGLTVRTDADQPLDTVTA